MPNEITKPNEDEFDEETLNYLRSSRIVDAINAALPQGSKALSPIPRDYVFKKRDREAVSAAFHAAFQLTGGVPALAQWGGSNPDKFYPLYAKLLPSETETPMGGVTINFQTAVPTNPLDLVSVDETGRVFKIDGEDLPD